MNWKIIYLMSLVFLVGCESIETTQDYSSEIVDAQYLGKTLYEDITSEDGTEQHTNREADLIKMISDKGVACDGSYKAVSTFNNSANEENLFLILFPNESEGVQFGRHFRFRFRQGTNDLIDISPSTKSCLLVPATGRDIPYATHLLSNTPNEFHVFLSLYHKKEIYISTSAGLWSVKNGLISAIEN